ncbi:MAG: tetratricopeptide repeat protein, partial [Elusimicrobiales bacterium]|nr:tetratricopeptide repeat protein [Elusimicrobiales bacterium]
FFMFLLLSAIASFRLGNFYSGGLVFWQRVLADNPGYKDAYYQIINIHQFQGDYDAAAEAAKKVLDLNPSDLQSNFLYAVHLSNAGKKDVAEKEFLKIINLSGGNPEYLSVYGKFLEELGRLPEAEKALKKAAESAPDYQKSRYNYGTFLLSQQKWKEAEIELRAALSAKKDILSVNIDEDSCRKKLAYVILRQAENAADNASMSAMAAEAADIAPFPEVYEHSAYLLMDKKEYAAAEKMFVFALTGDPGRVSSAIGAGIAAAKAGNISKSEHYLLLALKIDPENEKAKEILEKIQKL